MCASRWSLSRICKKIHGSPNVKTVYRFVLKLQKLIKIKIFKYYNLGGGVNMY